jgi:predicted CoA-binding protein
MEIVAVVGASEKPERYANRALRMLLSQGLKGYASLAAIPHPVDTVTIYVSPEGQTSVLQDLLAIRPRRVIFNPGAENSEATAALARAGITVIEACTLVLLSTGQF